MKTFNKIILLFFIFSSSLLAEWEVYIDSIDSDSGYFFVNLNADENALISIIVDIELMDDWSAAYGRYSIAGVFVYSDKINFDDSCYLKIKRNSKNSINYNISEYNIVEVDDLSGIFIGNKDQGRGAGRVANNLIKILLDSISCDLYNEDELLASFNLAGLKRIMEENIGDTEWYNHLYK